MKLLYSLYDAARDYFYPPAPFLDDDAAKAVFSHLCEDKEIHVGQRPIDFELHRLGAYDEETGELFSDPKRILRGAELTLPATAETIEAL